MLAEIYIEAFDEELADQVWEAWNHSGSGMALSSARIKVGHVTNPH